MKKAKLIIGIILVITAVMSMAYAGGDKVRGEKGLGEVNQVNFDAMDNQG